MTFKTRNSLLANDRGQMFVGYIIALMLITLVSISVMQQVRRLRVNTDHRIYQDEALAIARQGFEEGLSYFQRQPNGVYLDQGAEKPAGQNWITPWPIYPDAAFLPQVGDTDHAGMLTFAANVAMTSSAGVTFAQRAGAMAIIRTFPLFVDPSITTTAKPYSISPVWGSYVIRRQNARNWSPGPDTYSAFTDPEAAHDLTGLQSQDAPGEGDYWSMVSHGYVFTNPSNTTVTTGFEDPTMYEGNSILNAPRHFYHNKPFLLASARVYGELNRINFKDQTAAVWMTNQSQLTLNQKGFINGGTQGNGCAYYTGSTPGVSGTISGQQKFYSCGLAPSVGSIFPGFTKASLQRRASANCYGPISIFPAADSTTLTATASQNLFYYETGNADFLGSGSANVMTGIGLVIIDGNLTFEANNPSTWSGIVVVLGSCTMHGPAIIQGTLVVTGTLTIGDPNDNNNAEVDYNSDSIASVTSFLQNFKVDKQSIIATFN
jgi:hypothetical protein